MDGTLLEVTGSAPNRRAVMGTTKVHRVDGSACYDMNLGREAPKSCGNQQTPNLIVEQKSSVRLDFLEPDQGRRPTWIDGAKLVRARMPAIPNHFYDDKYIYGIRTDEPTFPQPSCDVRALRRDDSGDARAPDGSRSWFTCGAGSFAVKIPAILR